MEIMNMSIINEDRESQQRMEKENSTSSSICSSLSASSSTMIMNETIIDELKNNSTKTTTTAPIDLNNCNTNTTNVGNKVLTGVIVNGFHPQLYTWKENSELLESYGDSNGGANNHKRSRANSSLEEGIQEKVTRARNDTVQDIHNMQIERETKRIKMMKETSISSMYSEMFENSKVPQLIVAPGGRIAAWNQEFLNRCGNNKYLQSRTAFDIVAPNLIPKLYEIFLMALSYNDDQSVEDGKDQDHEVKYPTLTVPCVPFTTGAPQHYITFSLMYDKDPEKRCFHCILSTDHKEPFGEIYSVSQTILMGMLC